MNSNPVLEKQVLDLYSGVSVFTAFLWDAMKINLVHVLGLKGMLARCDDA